MNLQEFLGNIGLTTKEIAVYTTTLNSGPSPVSHIAEHSGLKRTSTYHILNSLKERGLVTHFIRNDKTVFEALDHTALDSHLQNQISKAQQSRMELQAISTEIYNLTKNIAYNKNNITIFEGNNSVFKVWYKMLQLKPGETIYDIEASHLWSVVTSKKSLSIFNEEWRKFTSIRIKSQIKVNFVSTTPVPVTNTLTKQNLMRYTDGVYITPEIWPIPLEVGVFDSNFYIITFEQHPVSIIIDNKIIAEMFKILYKNYRNLVTQNEKHEHIVIN